MPAQIGTGPDERRPASLLQVKDIPQPTGHFQRFGVSIVHTGDQSGRLVLGPQPPTLTTRPGRGTIRRLDASSRPRV